MVPNQALGLRPPRSPKQANPSPGRRLFGRLAGASTHLPAVPNCTAPNLVPAQGQPVGTGLVYLLAVSTLEAERLAYLTSFESLYFSLVSNGASPVGPTTGSSIIDALKQF